MELTTQWESLHQFAITSSDPDLIFFVLVPVAIMIATYWIIGGAFLLLDFIPPIRELMLRRKVNIHTYTSHADRFVSSVSHRLIPP